MENASDAGLEFLDLKLKRVEGEIRSSIFAKSTIMKVLPVVVRNVISAISILYLIINLSVRLLVEYTVLEGAFPVTALMLLTLFLVRKNFGDSHKGAATDFKTRFRIHKCEIKTK